jgi:DNA-binding IclR family transcriptional regulator
MSKTAENARTVKSDQTLLDLMEALRERGTMGVTELATELDLAKSSVHRHLQTLRKNGYVVRQSGSYALSFEMLRYTAHIRDRNELCTEVRPVLYEIAKELDEFVTFAVEEQKQSVFVYSTHDKYGFAEKLPLLGSQCHMHQNAAGKAILAEFPDDQIEEVIERDGLPSVTEKTITDAERLFEEIDQIREQGYALNIEERTPILRSVAVPVVGPESDTIGAISVAGPAKRLDRKTLESEYASYLLRVVNELELQLEYR